MRNPSGVEYINDSKKRIAENVYDKLYGKPKSHSEWAKRFNVIWEIYKVLIA